MATRLEKCPHILMGDELTTLVTCQPISCNRLNAQIFEFIEEVLIRLYVHHDGNGVVILENQKPAGMSEQDFLKVSTEGNLY
ncbi:hypothetical protein LQ952_02690 [Ectothiorhodospira sp. B14B]|nr:hypothetical protein [Ectothiorhodospira lacustris]